MRPPIVPPADDSLDELYSRPGFMIRRAHQIASDIFVEGCQSLDLTPSQYGVMYILNAVGATDQIGIARLIGLDRSTTALVVRILSERGWIEKKRSVVDQRRAEIVLTPSGEGVLKQARQLAAQSKEDLLAPFTGDEKQQFLQLLGKFVDFYNKQTSPDLAG